MAWRSDPLPAEELVLDSSNCGKRAGTSAETPNAAKSLRYSIVQDPATRRGVLAWTSACSYSQQMLASGYRGDGDGDGSEGHSARDREDGDRDGALCYFRWAGNPDWASASAIFWKAVEVPAFILFWETITRASTVACFRSAYRL